MESQSVISAADFREAMSRIASTVSILTSRGSNGDVAITATSVQALSDTPASLLACVNINSRLIRAAEDSKLLCVNVLHCGDIALAKAFARPQRGVDEFDMSLWHRTESGVLILRRAITAFECTVEETMRFGTHKVLVGSIRSCYTAPGSPLTYLQRTYGEVNPIETSAFA